MKSVITIAILTALAIFAACDSQMNKNAANANSTANVAANANANANVGNAAVQILTEVERPQKIKDMMSGRGEQDAANPTLKVIEPKDGATVSASTVKVKLELGGDLKGYQTMKDPATGMGNHIHIILDNQPYEAYYNLESEFELRNVADGEHTLRFFPSRPWHESYKNEGAFQTVKFTVKNGGADNTKPTTANNGNTMATPTPEGKEMANSTAGAVDFKKPLLTYSRPKGEYKGADADPIMIDFWLANAKLAGDGGEYRVRYSVDGSVANFIEKWQPIWVSGWSNGKHTIKLELTDKNGNLIENGGYNSTAREITVSK